MTTIIVIYNLRDGHEFLELLMPEARHVNYVAIMTSS